MDQRITFLKILSVLLTSFVNHPKCVSSILFRAVKSRPGLKAEFHLFETVI